MNRTQLDAFMATHTLDVSQVKSALAITGNSPKTHEWRAFAATSLTWAGIAALVAGLIFFVAANWQSMGVLGRFALLQAILAGSLGVAWWQASKVTARETAKETAKATQLFTIALVVATFVTGTLLALFGQTYQTGADVYELFFGWALLTVPFAIAAKSGALWIIWVCILNIGLALLCGWGNNTNFGWRLFNGFGMGNATVLMIPFVVNGLGALILIIKTGWRAPKYGNLQRLLLTFSLVYGTAALLMAMQHALRWNGTEAGGSNAAELGILLLLVLSCAALVWHTLKVRRDVYPLALVATSAIVISTAYIVKLFTRGGDIGVIFFIGFWIIGASTVAGFVLMHYVRAWHTHTPSAREGEITS